MHAVLFVFLLTFASSLIYRGDGDTDHEPGELECWATIEAQLLCDKATSRPVVTFEDGLTLTTGIEFDDLAESVRNRLKEISSGRQKEVFSSPGNFSFVLPFLSPISILVLTCSTFYLQN